MIIIATASELLSFISQEVKIQVGPCGASNPSDVRRETLTLKPRWSAGAYDNRLSFAASSEAVGWWACAVSFQFVTADNHSIYVFTSGDESGKEIFSSRCPSSDVSVLASSVMRYSAIEHRDTRPFREAYLVRYRLH